MFVRPSLVSVLRSSWKSIKESPYFLLQQQNGNNSKRRQFPEYRIITRGFPHYKVAESDDFDQISESFDDVLPDILSEIEGKKTMKKILKKLKDRYSKESPSDEDGDGYLTDSSVTPEDGNSSGEVDDHDQDQDNYSLEVNSSSASTKSENAVAGDKGKSKMTDRDRDLATQSPDQLDFPVNHSDFSDLNSDSSDVDANNDGGADPEGVDWGIHVDEWWPLGSNLMYSLMDWLGGPPVGGIKAVSAKQTTTANNLSNNKNETILDIPMQFVALLTYPEIDPKASKKSSFAVLREISFVKQRRKVLMMFTLYLFIMRVCSFDLFLVLLFASNCGMLFLMKNSGKVNVTMAKRAVRQRIGWAKQWAGSLFRHRANSTHPSNNNNNNLTSGNSRKNNTSASTTQMVKSGSLDAIHSGSMSDTTYGGSVTRKMAPKRGGFFRNRGGHTSTTSQATKDNNNSERPVGTITAEPSSFLDTVQHEYSKNSLVSPLVSSQAPTLSGGIPMQTSLSSQLQNLSTGIATEVSHTPALTKRRFFPKRIHSSSSHNNNSVTTYLSSQPLHNGVLSDIVEHKSSSPPPSNVYPAASLGQNDTMNGILNNNETIGVVNNNKVVNGTNSNNNGSVSNGHSTRSLPSVIGSNNNSNDSNNSNGSNSSINASRTLNRSSTGTFDTDFLNFDDPNELFSLVDEVRTKKSTKYSRTVGHRKNNSGDVVNLGTHETQHPDEFRVNNSVDSREG